MAEVFNIYCDESCHLENDKKPVMAIAALWCPLETTRAISKCIREIKAKWRLPPDFEIKWIKVSPGKVKFYLDIIDYFFRNDNLHFRAVVIPEKSSLDHNSHNQSHDDWYYKMFFVLLKEIIEPNNSYRIYIDIKDTKSEEKRAKLEEILRNSKYDASGQIIERVQQIRSHESELLQVTDLLLGALRYENEKLSTSTAKLAVIGRIKSLSGKSLLQTTWPREPKLNILRWHGQGENL